MNRSVVFMGTPEFAVASLAKLYDSGFNIVGVVTSPDKLAGRGMKLTESAVKQYASGKGLNILQPEKLKAPEFIQALQLLNADLFVVVAFRMLPEIVWSMPPMGTINLHGSLLPQYRGAAPINWAIINGEKETGVTTFKLKHDIDTGNILEQVKIKIEENETAGSLHDKMKVIGATLLSETITKLFEGKIKELPQTAQYINLKHAPKIFTETCKIDWNSPSEYILNLIRGLSPVPGAFTYLMDKKLKIFNASINKIGQQNTYPGNILTDSKSFLRFETADGELQLLEIQLEGKKRMGIEEFLRGQRIFTK
ncbi:MAG: methionyl-tRNA formyltransferase [Ginsengibacter sp.]